jgi:microcystin-dependent protein
MKVRLVHRCFFYVFFTALLPAFVVSAQLPNAWQINDNGSGVGVIQYITDLTSTQVSAADSNGWRYDLVSRMVSDSGGPATQSMAFGDGTRLFCILFGLDGSGRLTAQLLGDTTYTLTSAAEGTNYHVHEMTYDPVTGDATYRMDGTVITSWPGEVSSGQPQQVTWGANASPGMGVMNNHYADFEIIGQGAIATYDAGFAGNPAVAPSPISQGWARFASGGTILEAAVSPDSVYVPPLAITGAAASVRPGQATLNASINPNSQPAAYWFEHGPTTNYGSTTPISTLASGINFVTVSNLVTALPRGLPYHFRVVASNSTSQVAGADMSFTVPEGPAAPSGTTGGGEPFDIRQPSLELNYIICTNGSYPISSGNVLPPFLGEVRLFAGNFAPAGWAFCQGQLLSLADNTSLYSVFGATYGGDGATNFAVPDLRARTAIGAGSGPGLSSWVVGQNNGFALLTLTTIEIPAHTHSLPPPDTVTGSAGGGQARQNLQPSLSLSYLVAVAGQYPLSGGQVVFERFLGQIMLFAGSYFVGGSSFASGQLLSINQNQALYSLVGTNYGGDGQTMFALPDLRSRVPMGTGQGAGSAWSLGQQTGVETVTMTEVQMPAHQHTVPSLGIMTGFTGSNQPQTLMQPSLAVQYLIATNGEIPSTSVQATNEMIGEIQLYAGTNVPGGWAPCDGSLLQIAGYPAVFGVISNYFGGDGVTTFALPDLRGRIPVGSTNGQPGATYGAEQAVLTIAQMPPHTHTAPVLDYDRWITSFGLSNSAAAFDADADADGVRNGYEWATGTNPTNAESFVPLTINSAGNGMMIRFPRNTNATDVTFLLQRTAGLNNSNAWTAIATNSLGGWTPPAIVTETGATNPVNVSVSDARTNRPSADYRLQITWP